MSKIAWDDYIRPSNDRIDLSAKFSMNTRAYNSDGSFRVNSVPGYNRYIECVPVIATNPLSGHNYMAMIENTISKILAHESSETILESLYIGALLTKVYSANDDRLMDTMLIAYDDEAEGNGSVDVYNRFLSGASYLTSLANDKPDKYWRSYELMTEIRRPDSSHESGFDIHWEIKHNSPDRIR